MVFYCKYLIARVPSLCQLARFVSKVPDKPIRVNRVEISKVQLSSDEIALLERLSLVKCDTEAGVNVLQDAIRFAEQVMHIPAHGVEPMYTVLEDRSLSLRQDIVTEGDCQKDILRNAAVTEEEYFVAPPGNIPLQSSESSLQLKKKHTDKGKELERHQNAKPSPCGQCMKQNIINEWMHSVYLKSFRKFKVYVKNEKEPILKHDVVSFQKQSKDKGPLGLLEISQGSFEASERENEQYFKPSKATELKLSIALDKHAIMPFFLQWQRYRKIWWSTVTTSPSLFHLRDITYRDGSAEVEVIANFPWGMQPVEKICFEQPSMGTKTKSEENFARFESMLTVECALLTLFTDGYSNRTEEGYVRIHRTMAPYKVSFAIDCEDELKKNSLKELAELLNYRLNERGVSTWLPDDSDKSVNDQLVARYELGVPYTVVLESDALDTGILRLLSSSTTLKEQIHISDFISYQLRLLKSCFDK